MAYEHGAEQHRLPAWLQRPIAHGPGHRRVESVLSGSGLSTVCVEARCPNRGECYAKGTATFLIAGDACTRGCRFCAIETRRPAPLDPEEPAKVARAVKRLGLRHAVITMVTRDDLADGAAGHVAATISEVARCAPETTVEVLVSDFAGEASAVDTVVAARPDVFNHNIETVPRLYEDVRPGASYRRSLAVLARAKKRAPGMPTKSGLMVGLGETLEEVVAVMHDLRAAGCDFVTIGQYLRPSARHLPVAEFVEPEEFARLARIARTLGFAAVASAPFVRSSYDAAQMLEGR